MNIGELTATDADKSKIGIWLNTADSQITEISTGAGFDWVCVDLQHGLAEMGDLSRLLPIVSDAVTESKTEGVPALAVRFWSVTE